MKLNLGPGGFEVEREVDVETVIQIRVEVVLQQGHCSVYEIHSPTLIIH